MADNKQPDEAPLTAEALKRDEWRGDASQLRRKDAPGHTLPESERDPTSESAGQQGSGAAPGTVAPPD